MGKVFRRTGWRHVVAWIALIFALFPVAWVVSAAFSDGNLSSQSLIPTDPTLDNFRALMTDPGHPPFWSWFRNSMFIGVTTAVLTVAMCALAAFAFSRLRFKGRRPGLLSLLLIQMFPNLLAVVALFLFMTRIKGLFPAIGLGSSWGLIFIYLGGALGVNTYLIKGFFDTIPYTLDEAAKIDGCTHFQIFYKIILPLAAPVLAVIGLLSFITIASRVPRRQRHAQRGQQDARRRPVGLRPRRVRQSLGTVRCRLADRRDPGRAVVHVPAALHRVRPHVRRRQGMTRPVTTGAASPTNPTTTGRRPTSTRPGAVARLQRAGAAAGAR